MTGLPKHVPHTLNQYEESNQAYAPTPMPPTAPPVVVYDPLGTNLRNSCCLQLPERVDHFDLPGR